MSRPHFRRAEYAARVAKTRREMAARDIELLFVAEQEDGVWIVWYGPVRLGSVDPTGRFKRPKPKRRRRKPVRG